MLRITRLPVIGRSLVSRLLIATVPVALVVVALVAGVASPLLRTTPALAQASSDLVEVQRLETLLATVNSQPLHWAEYTYLPTEALGRVREEMAAKDAEIAALERGWVDQPPEAVTAFATYADISEEAAAALADVDAGSKAEALATLTSRVLPRARLLTNDLELALLARTDTLKASLVALEGALASSRLGSNVGDGVSDVAQEAAQSLALEDAQNRIVRQAAQYVEGIATGSAEALRAASRLGRTVGRDLALLVVPARMADPQEASTIEEIAALRARMTALGARVRSLVESGRPVAAADIFERRIDPLLVDQLLPLASGLIDKDRQDLAASVAGANADARRLSMGVRAGGVLTLLLLLLPGLLIGISTVRPLRRIRHAADEVAGGNLAARTGVSQRSEVGELARAFDDMARQVQQSRGALLSAAVLEASSDLLLIVKDGLVSYASGASSSLLGVAPGDVVGRRLLDLVHPPDRAALAAGLADPPEAGAVQVQMTTRDGGVDTEVVVADLRRDPQVAGLVLSVRDVTERKRHEEDLATARDEAVEASRMKSDFLATMSHEIRTPMNGVIGLTGLLLTTELDERQRQYAQGVRGAGEALLMIINDILDFSKVEAGKLELEEIDFSPVQVVEEAAELIADQAQNKGLELLAYCSPEIPLGLRGDPSRLRQVLLNLASNAVKFTDPGEVVLSAHVESRPGDGIVVRFTVTDTGMGIGKDDQERLFEPFSQADSSTTRKFGGTGLGLAISTHLVTAMGGALGVESAVGEGSTFWFTLPLRLAHNQAVTAPRAARQLEGLRALVVDDNRTNRLVLSEQLGAWGMSVDVVGEGVGALQLLGAAQRRGQSYDMALLDLCMPEMDGLELARQISADPALSATSLVLLTSGPDVTLDQAREVGITERLTKPLRMSRLQAALQNVAAPARRVRRASAAESATPAPGSLGHVLVVEDNSTNQLVAVGILEYLGYSTEVAGNGFEALAALARTTFDAVLMDCQMPEMDGYTATAELRRIESQERHTPIIAMTAGATEGDRERCLAAGMDDYVSKPVDPDAVASILALWLAGPPAALEPS